MKVKVKVLRIGCYAQWKEIVALKGQVVDAEIKDGGCYIKDPVNPEIELFLGMEDYEIVK